MYDHPTEGGRNPKDMDISKLIKGRGCLKLSAYVHYGMLTVHVMQAKHLRSGVSNRCNTCVTVALEPDPERQTECKTRVVEDTNQPLVDEKFSYELLEDDFRKRLMVCVWNTTPNHPATELLGCMSFGLRHIMTKKTEVNGWYFLLSEELGRRKHLKAAISRNQNGQPLSTTGTSSQLENLNNMSVMSMSMASNASFCTTSSEMSSRLTFANRSMRHHPGHHPHHQMAGGGGGSHRVVDRRGGAGGGGAHNYSMNTSSLNASSFMVGPGGPNVSYANPDASSMFDSTFMTNPNNTMFDDTSSYMSMPGGRRNNTMRVNTSFTDGENTTFMDSSRRKSPRRHGSSKPVSILRTDSHEFAVPAAPRPAEVSYVERKKEVSFCLPPDASFSNKSSSSMRRSRHHKSGRSKLDDLENVWMDTMTVVLKKAHGNIGFTLTGENPAQVCNVTKGSVAEKSGLKENDYIMSINGLCVSNGTTQTVATVIRHCISSKLIIEVQRPKPLIKPPLRNTFSPPLSSKRKAGPPPGVPAITSSTPAPAHGLKRKALNSSMSSLASLSQRTGQKMRQLMNRSSSFLKIR